MKVCLVLASVGEGGLEGHVATLANSLASVVEVVVVAPLSFGSKLAPGVVFAPVDLTRNRRNPFVLWELFRTLRRYRPDLVHAHANKAAAMVGVVRRFYPASYVATVHGSKRNTGVYQKFDHVIAVSRSVAASMSGVPVTVIYNGVNSASDVCAINKEMLALDLGLDVSRPFVAAVGRLAPVKGYDLLLQAWQTVDAELLLVGDGPERERLQALAQKLGVLPRVHFLGFRSDATAIMAVSDLVVISSHREGFPLVLVEALQRGIPVLSTEVSGAMEILPAEMLVPVGDAVALAKRINELFAMPRSELLEKCREPFRLAREELTLTSCVSNTLKLYRAVINS